MKKTKKIAALACAGIVACGIAALPISAATTNTGDVTVQYIAGTVNTLILLCKIRSWYADRADRADF